MTDFEWCKAICLIDGNALRKWLQEHTQATQKQIDRIVGVTGPRKPGPNVEALKGLMRGV